MPATHPLNGQKWPGTDTYYWDPGKAPGEPGFVAPPGYVAPANTTQTPPAGSFDQYAHDHVDGKIKDNNGDPRHGGGNNKPDATLGDLDANGAKVDAAPVVLENFDGMSYEDVYNRMSGVSENIAPGYDDTLRGVAQQIVSGMTDMQDRLATLESDGGWKGKTHDAAMSNLQNSYGVPDELRRGAVSLGVLSEYFSQTMSTNKHNILDQWSTYQDCLSKFPSDTDTVKQYFNAFARDVMKNYYSPEINDIASHQPAIDSTATQPVPLSPAQTVVTSDPSFTPETAGVDPTAAVQATPRHALIPTTPGSAPVDGSGAGSGPTGSQPNFSPPNLSASDPSGGSPGGGASGDGSSSGGGASGGGSPSGGGTSAPSFNPPASPNIKTPDTSAGAGDGSGSGTGGQGATAPTMPTLGATQPDLPALDASGDPAATGPVGTGSTFDPSKVLTDPKALAAANKLFDDPKTADAAKKIFGDPKLADAAKTLFGDGAKGLLNDPKALDAAKTLFGDPEAADAAKTLFGDPDTAKAAQKLLDDPHLTDIGRALRDSGALQTNGQPNLDSNAGAGDPTRSLLAQPGLGSASGIPGLSAGTGAGSSDGASSLIGGIMDGVNQIVQTAEQGANPQAPGMGGGPGVDGTPGGPPDHPGGGAGGGAGSGAAGPGKLHLAAAGAPVAAANLSSAAHPGVLHPGVDASQAGAAGGGSPSGGGHGGGGKGGEAKDHKGNKALRGNQNGQNVIGQPDAVVSVIGDDGADGGQSWSMDN